MPIALNITSTISTTAFNSHEDPIATSPTRRRQRQTSCPSHITSHSYPLNTTSIISMTTFVRKQDPTTNAAISTTALISHEDPIATSHISTASTPNISSLPPHFPFISAQLHPLNHFHDNIRSRRPYPQTQPFQRQHSFRTKTQSQHLTSRRLPRQTSCPFHLNSHSRLPNATSITLMTIFVRTKTPFATLSSRPPQRFNASSHPFPSFTAYSHHLKTNGTSPNLPHQYRR